MSRLSLTVLLLVLAALGLSACGGDESSDSTAASAPTPETTEIGCEQVAEPQPKGDQDLDPPDEKLDPGRTYVATVKTTCGEFDITLDVERAPKTTASFAHLVERDFYDGLTFHRISPGFVIQGGDPLGDGTGGPGYSVHEPPPQSLSYDKGVVAMAKAGDEAPGTSGSQFFVVTEDASLTADYSLLGEVTRGMDVVEKISAAAVDNFEKPTEPIVIRDITMKRPLT